MLYLHYAWLCNDGLCRKQQSVEKSQPADQTTVQPTTMSAEEINDRNLDKFISDMTLEEKVGQMFFVRCPDEDAVQQVSEYNIGGYILFFGRDFDGKTKDEVVDDIPLYQEADIPLLIGVDERRWNGCACQQ